MEEKLKRQLVNLNGFLHLYLVPANRRMEAWRAALGRAGDSADQLPGRIASIPLDRLDYLRFGGQLRHSQLALWEAYLWLHLGTVLEYFPQSETEILLRESRALFPEYYATYVSIGDLIPGRLHLALSRALARGWKSPEYFVDLGYGRFQHPESLQPIVSTLLLVQGAFAADAMAQSTVGVLTFDDDTLWRSYMNDHLDRAKLDAAFAHIPGEHRIVSKETLLAGFFRILSYLGYQKDLRHRPEPLSSTADSSFSIEEAAALLDWAREICFWRVNFFRRKFKERFLELAESAGSSLMLELQQSGLGSPNLRAFMSEVMDLLNFWSSDVIMELGKGQGG